MAHIRNKKDLKYIVKDTINELFSSQEFINGITRSITDKIEQKLKHMEDKVEKLMEAVRKQEEVILNLQQQELINVEKFRRLELHNERSQQEKRENNVCIHGIPEEPTENLNSRVIDLLRSKVEIIISDYNIAACYRVGKRDPTKHKPIILKLVNKDIKQKILKNSIKLKGSGVFISDDLTTFRRKLLMEARASLGSKNVRTFNGVIYANLGGKYSTISEPKDIVALLN